VARASGFVACIQAAPQERLRATPVLSPLLHHHNYLHLLLLLLLHLHQYFHRSPTTTTSTSFSYPCFTTTTCYSCSCVCFCSERSQCFSDGVMDHPCSAHVRLLCPRSPRFLPPRLSPSSLPRFASASACSEWAHLFLLPHRR
jgi:hypothetical protein